MEQKTRNYCDRVWREIGEAVPPLGLRLVRLENEETSSALLEPAGNTKESWGIICTLSPVRLNGVPLAILQMTLPLTPPAPDQREELQKLVLKIDGQLAPSRLVVSQDRLILKDTLILDPDTPVSIPHLQKTLYFFCQQMGQYMPVGLSICAGLTAEEAADDDTGEGET